MVELIELTTNRRFARRKVLNKKQLKAMARHVGIKSYLRLGNNQLVEREEKSLEDVENEVDVKDKREALGGVFRTVIIKRQKHHNVEIFMQVGPAPFEAWFQQP